MHRPSLPEFAEQMAAENAELRRACKLASEDSRLQSSGQDDYVLKTVRDAMKERK